MKNRRVALITGAAGGLGQALTRDLASRGYELALTDLAAPHALPSDAFFIDGDLSELSFVEGLVDRVVAQCGRIDLLVNAAAWRELLTLRTITPQSFEKTLRIGLTAPAFLARSAAAHMERQQRGVIVNVSSIMADRASGIAPAYVAAKGGLDALTRDLAVLYGRSGVRAVGVAPGAFDGPTSHDYGPADQALKTYSEQMIPLGRWATADEVARVIGWLASDEAAYISGTTVVIDGGWTASLYPRNISAQIMPTEFT